MSDSLRPSDAAIRDEAASRADSGAPRGEVENLRLVSRPIYLEEEGASDRSDWWSLAKALLIGVGVIGVLGWLLTR